MGIAKITIDLHMELALGLVTGGVAAVKNSRRPDKGPDSDLHRRSVLDATLNPQCRHSHGLREPDGPGHAPH